MLFYWNSRSALTMRNEQTWLMMTQGRTYRRPSNEGRIRWLERTMSGTAKSSSTVTWTMKKLADLLRTPLSAENKQQANEMRRQQLSAYGLSKGHWTVDAHDKDLEYRGIPHAAPMPKLTMTAGKWRSPPGEYIAAGQPQATEFPTYEQLNLGQDARYKLGRPAPLDVNKNYQQLRENYL